MEPRKSPETGMVRVLYIGEPVGGPGPYRFMDQDPFLDMSPVQATTAWYGLDVIKRSLRIYMPRTYGELISGQDVVVLSDANRELFSGSVLKWFSDGVTVEGMGLLMTGGRESFGAYFGMPDWTPTSVGQILPVASTMQEKGPDGELRVLMPDNPLMASLPWDSIGRYGYFFGCNPVEARDGAETLAELVPATGEAIPSLVWWDIGAGRSFAMTSDWTPAGANLFLQWEFYPDYGINLALFIADVEIPPDPILVHEIRQKTEEYHLTRNFVLSLVEFISKFGANPARVETMLSQANDRLAEANAEYTSYNFEASLAILEGLIADLDEATTIALRLKDQALLWVYIVEWAAIMGTSIMAGVVIWTLMVRRRLYHEVATTSGISR
jgi:uncharacterized membrane protein